MKLPNAENAVVERQKITYYLLNRTHVYGASKARFFGKFGFRAEEWWVFAEALLEHGPRPRRDEVPGDWVRSRYEVEGTLLAPDGRRPHVCTVWQLDHGAVAPRLITAYPTKEPQ